MSSQRSGRGEAGTALITGGAGFIGGFLCRKLVARGFRVHLLDNLSRGRRDAFLLERLASDGVELLEQDLGDPEFGARAGVDYSHIFHFAAILGVQQVLEHPYATLRTNVALLEAALDLARRQRALERFVFASTSEVYAGSLEHLDLPIPTPEEVPLALPDLGRPRTAYMLSKLYGEALVRHSELPQTIVRPHNVYGPRMGNAHVIPQLLERAHRLAPGEALEVFSVDHSRCFCFVEDAVEMLARVALEPRGRGRVLNLGSPGPEIRMDALAELILRTVGRTAVIAPRPATPGSPARRCPDMREMEAVTGFRAATRLEEGVRRTYEWYRPEFESRPEATAP